ncbi:MAG: biopolymer transporter ExbD [Bacteroidota bacterium]|nr:biopolymer transporter ExbD [Bacteroidota bacterium]
MKIKRNHDFKAEVATASLNDIMFFLLLFFLIIATFANPNVIKLMLPKASSSQTISKKQITLSITAEKKYFLDQMPVAPENLEVALTDKKKSITDLTIILRADSHLTIQDLVDVLEIGKRVDVKMILATQKE